MIMTWMLMWLNKSVATINATLQLLDIYRFCYCSSNAERMCWLKNQSLLCKVGFHKYLVL